MNEPDWMTVLRIFWEENLSFEYTPNPESMSGFIPDDPDLEDINTYSHINDLLKSGHLEVKDVDLSHDPSVGIDSLNVVRISEKGLKAVREWETVKSKAQWERQLVETQEQYEENRLQKQQEFERKQVTRSNEVNAALGYLTIGLLIVTLSDVVLSIRQDLVLSWAALAEWGIIITTLIIVAILIIKIRKSGLLSPE